MVGLYCYQNIINVVVHSHNAEYGNKLDISNSTESCFEDES